MATSPIYTFVFEAAEDDSVDSQHNLVIDGVQSDIYIQDGRSYGAGYNVSELQRDQHGTIDGTKLHNFGVRSLKAAKAAAIAVHTYKV